MNLPKDDIVWAWNTTKLTSGQLARKYKTTKGVILGIIHRDPRAKQRRPHTPLQKAKKEIKALRAEVSRLQEMEETVMKALHTRNRGGGKAAMEAKFWKDLRKVLYEDQQQTAPAPDRSRMEWKAAA
jgi:hypothetical protein